jgi:hypothetical protein
LSAAAVFAIYKPHRNFPHYLLLSIVPFTCCMAAALDLTRIGKLWQSHHSAVAGAVVALFAQPMLSNVFSSPNEFVRNMAYHSAYPRSPVAVAIARHARRGDSISVWGWSPEYYVETGTVMATREAETTRLVYSNPYRNYFRERFMQDFRAWKPVVFVDAVAPGAFFMTDRASQGHEVFPALAAHISQNYTLKEEIGGVRIYVPSTMAALSGPRP